MQKALQFDGQDVDQSDLEFTEKSKCQEIARRFRDSCTSFGIVASDPAGDVTMKFWIANNNIMLLSGSCYDGNGEYISIPPLGVYQVSVSFTDADIGKFLIVRYKSVSTAQKAHPITGSLNPTREYDSATNREMTGVYSGQFYPGFEFLLLDTTDVTVTDVKVGRLISTDGQGGATIDTTVGYSPAPGATSHDENVSRYLYSARTAYGTSTDPIGEFIRHIRTLGTGTVTNHNAHGLSPEDIGAAPIGDSAYGHQLRFHSSGIARPYSGTNFKFRIDASTLPDRIVITQTDLSLGDAMHIQGKVVTTLNQPLELTFSSADSGDLCATFALYFSSTANIGKKPVAIWNTKGILGVQIIETSEKWCTSDMATHNITWTPNLGLKVDNGPYVVPGATGAYRLKGFANSDEYSVGIWVDYDTYMLNAGHPETTDEVVFFSHPDGLVTAFVPWDGLSDGHLGYGPAGQSGAVWDTTGQVLGFLREEKLSTRVRGDLDRRFYETRAAAAVLDPGNDFAISDAGGLSLTVPARVWYVNGVRVALPDATIGPLPDNKTSRVWIGLDPFNPFLVEDDTYDSFEPAPHPGMALLMRVPTFNGTFGPFVRYWQRVDGIDARFNALSTSVGAGRIGVNPSCDPANPTVQGSLNWLQQTSVRADEVHNWTASQFFKKTISFYQDPAQDGPLVPNISIPWSQVVGAPASERFKLLEVSLSQSPVSIMGVRRYAISRDNPALGVDTVVMSSINAAWRGAQGWRREDDAAAAQVFRMDRNGQISLAYKNPGSQNDVWLDSAWDGIWKFSAAPVSSLLDTITAKEVTTKRKCVAAWAHILKACDYAQLNTDYLPTVGVGIAKFQWIDTGGGNCSRIRVWFTQAMGASSSTSIQNEALAICVTARGYPDNVVNHIVGGLWLVEVPAASGGMYFDIRHKTAASTYSNDLHQYDALFDIIVMDPHTR